MKHAADLQLRRYSKGMLQRIGIAQALMHDPELVILDEPMTGLDPLGRKDIRNLILRLREEKKTVFFSTHILADVELVCDRVAILHASGSNNASETKIIDKLREEAGHLGANAIHIRSAEDAGNVERALGEVFGSTSDKDWDALALFCPSHEAPAFR